MAAVGLGGQSFGRAGGNLLRLIRGNLVIGKRALSDYYPIHDDVYGLTDEQKQVRKTLHTHPTQAERWCWNGYI